MEKVTEEVKVCEGRVEIPRNERIESVMEMYRWLKERIKEGCDEEELERIWEEMRNEDKVMVKLP